MKCFNTYCENGKEVEYLDDNTRVVTDEDCHICHGTGEVEDYCYCHSYTHPSECACGAWTIEEIEQFYNEDFEEEE